MKKIISSVLVFLMLFLLSSCSFSDIKNALSSEKNIDWSKYSAEKSEKKGSLYKNYFDNLNEDQKKAYNHILFELIYAEEEFPEKIEVPLMKGEELTQVYEAVVYDNTEIMCLGKNGSIITEDDLCYFRPEYTMTPSEMNDMLAEMENKAAEIKQLFDKNMSQYDKELIVHDYIIEHCNYNGDKSDSNMAYSCLFNGYASCEGYAKATKFLMERSGIECYNIIGNAENIQNETESHMWNAVKIDGDYYYIDTTWDDGVENTSHVYFNLNSNEMNLDHSNYNQSYDCSESNANYFEKNKSVFDVCDNEATSRMEDVVIKQLEKGTNYVEFKFKTKFDFDNAVAALIDRSKVYDIQKNIGYRRPDLKLSNEITYKKSEKHYVIQFVF